MDKGINRLVFIGGEHAAGKSTIIRHCNTELWQVVDVGPTLTSLYEQTSDGLDWQQWIDQNKHEHGDSYVADVALDEIYNQQNMVSREGAIVIGPRSLKIIDLLSQAINPRFLDIVFVSAGHDDMFSRYKQREDQPELTYQAFREKLEYDNSLGLHSVKENADFTVDNCDDLPTSVKRMDTLIGHLAAKA